MPVMIGGVACEVMSKGYEEHADPGGQGTTRSYLCPWDDRFKVSHALLGLVNYSGSGAGGSVSFEDPMGLEELPLQYCMSVRHEGKGRAYNNAVGLGYDFAVVHADYGMLPYTTGGGGGQPQIDPSEPMVYCTQELDSSETYIDIPGQVLTYPTGVASHVNRAIQVTVVSLSFQFHKLPYIPMPALVHAGKVNDALFLGIPKGKVKFDGVSTSRDYNVAGKVLQKATFKFSYRPIADFNAVPSFTTPGNWDILKYKGVLVYPYPYYDMRALWPVGYYNSA